MLNKLYRVAKQISHFCFNHITSEELSQIRTVVWSQSGCLLNPIVCHYPHLSAIQISLKESRKECSQHQGILSSVMCDSSRKLRGVQLFPLNTKDSGITSRLRHTSSWRKQPELSATSLTPRSHPPKPATTYPNYPTGIENSTGPCLMERLCEILHTQFRGTEGSWHRTAASSGCVKSRSHSLPFIRKVCYFEDSFTFGCTDHLKLRWRKEIWKRCTYVCVSVRTRDFYLCVRVHAFGIRISC